MSIEVTLLTTVLANALGSNVLAESLVKLFKEKLDKKTIDDSCSDEITAAEPKRLYLAGEQESKIVNEAAIEALDETYTFTAGIAAERMRQAKAAFNIALTLMIVGVLVIFAGVALLYFKEGIEQGLVTVVVGAVSEILSVIVLGFNRETNNRLDDLRKDMSVIETARVGLSFAKQIENQEKRDNAISELSLKIQG
ncbi:hypothetical protein D6V35_17875, partial [Vibrio cholerae]|nr:hypothetical protein [Vibrio cholerae]